MLEQRFIGRGFAFPMRVNATGGMAMVTEHQELVEGMRLILGTAIGERPMRPEFGCRIHDRIFDAINAMTCARVELDVREAIERWDPRVVLEQVLVSPHPDIQGALTIELHYSPANYYDPRVLVFPFYTIPDNADED